MKIGFLQGVLILAVLTFLMGCQNTFRGMKQDIRANTGDQSEEVTIKKTELVYPSPAPSLPTSPPPLQTPPR